MTTIYLSFPDNYEIKYSINEFTNANSIVNKKLANEQWSLLKNTLIGIDAQVKEISPPPFPDSVFIADSGILINGHFIQSKFKHSERENESIYWKIEFEKQGFQTITPPSNIIFEGTGDCLISDSVTLIGYGNRTDTKGVEYLSSFFGSKLIPVKLTSNTFFHLDTCVAMVSDELIMVYPDAICKSSLKKLTKKFKIIEITEKEALNFTTNIININNKIVMQKGNDRAANLVRKNGYDVLEVDTSEYMKAGGSCKCLSIKSHNIQDINL